MIIIHSSNSTILRVPKTGSTSLEASIRMAPGCLQAGDYASTVDDANLDERGSSGNLDTMRADHRVLRKGIREARLLASNTDTTPVYTVEEQAYVDDWDADIAADTFKYTGGIPHGTLDTLVDPDTFGPAGLITHAQILSYNHYAFIRNPLNRALSGWIFMRATGVGRGIPAEMIDFHDDILNGGMKRMVYRQQSDYFKYQGNFMDNGSPIVTPLLFEDFAAQLTQLITTLGGTPLNEYPRFKANQMRELSLPDPKPSVADWITPFPAVKQAILDRYPQDVTIWETTSGLTL
jgi:hypothetical protein